MKCIYNVKQTGYNVLMINQPTTPIEEQVNYAGQQAAQLIIRIAQLSDCTIEDALDAVLEQIEAGDQ